MEPGNKRTLSMVSAAVLAVLTLSVFLVSLNKGPASAVTRFHEGLSRPDPQMIREVTGGDVNSPSSIELRQKIAAKVRPGWRFQVIRIDKAKTDAVVIVVYESSSGGIASVPFVLRKFHEAWLIDSGATLSLIAAQQPG